MSDEVKPVENEQVEPYVTVSYMRKTDSEGKANDCDLRVSVSKEAASKGEQHVKEVVQEFVFLCAVIACREHEGGFEAGVDSFANELKEIYKRAQDTNVST